MQGMEDDARKCKKCKKIFMALKKRSRVEAAGELQNPKLYQKNTERTRRLIHKLLFP